MTSDGGAVIKVFDVATRSVSSWKVVGQNPSWSPTGAHIAFIRGPTLMLMNPSGTNVRALNTRTYGEQPISWSRDGRWIVARSSNGLELVDASDGTVLQITHLNDFYAASLK